MDLSSLQQAGFSPQEINDHLKQAGFSDAEIAAQNPPPPEPDMKPIANYIQKNLDAANSPPDGLKPSEDQTPPPPKSWGEQMLQSIENGWQMSTAELVARNKLPDVPPVEHADMAMKIASGVATLAGDVPAMVAGWGAGTLAGGAAAGPPGAVGGGLFGMGAVPAALRQAYIDHLQKGDVQDFGDLWSRAMSASWEGLKGGATNLATAGVGGAVGGKLAETAASPLVQTLAKSSAEIATMTTVGKALEGQIPKPEDFVIGAAQVGLMHGITSTLSDPAKSLTTKLQDIYAATGIKPDAIASEAKINPVLQQELLHDSKDIPPSLRPMIEPPQPNQEILGKKPEMVSAKIPDELNEQSPVFAPNGEFTPQNDPQVEKAEEPEEKAPPESSGGNGNEPPSARDIIADKMGPPEETNKPESFDSQYAKIVDELDPLKNLSKAIAGGEEIPKSEDPYVLFGKATAQSFERARMAIESGPVDFETGKPTGEPGLKQIMAPFKDDPNGFKFYMLARRTVEVDERGIKTTIPVEAAKQYVEENSDKYEEAHRQVVDWNNQGLDDLQKSGVLSKKQVADIKVKNQEYIPLQAYAEDGTSGSSRGSRPIRGLKGNEDLQLVDPVESMIKNRYAFSKLAEENVAKQSLVDLATKYDAPSELLERIPTPVKAIKVSSEELSKYLAANGIAEDQCDTDTMKIWRAAAVPLRENQFSVMQNGERSIYQVDPSIAKAFQATGSTEPTNMLMKIPNAIAAAQRIGTTLDPFFLLKHAIRDQFAATIYSQNGYRFAWDGLRGLGHIFKSTDQWNEFLANGGGMTTLSDFHNSYIKDDFWGLSQQTGLIDKATNLIRTPYERMEMIAKAVFNAPKMGEYLRSREAGNDVTTAVDDARNVTPNVMRTGSAEWVKTWSAATPFASMRIRGMDQMVNAFKTDPIGTSLKMSLGITAISLATWWNGKDDERYKQAPSWEKDLFWVVPIGGDPKDIKSGVTLRIPKPFEPGLIFGSLAERTLNDYYQKDPEAFKGFGEALVGGALPNVIPAAAMPMLEQFGNRSWLTGGNIIPERLKEVAPAYQYTPYTSETAKAVGRLIGYIPGVSEIGPKDAKISSPAIVQNYIREWTGTLGGYALDLIDKGAEMSGKRPEPPTPNLTDIPFIKEFVVRNPSAGAQPIQDFYDNYQKTNQTMSTLRLLQKSGDQQGYNSFISNRSNQENMLQLDGVAKTLGAMEKAVNGIYVNPDMKPAEKRQLIDGIYAQMVQTAREGNKMLKMNKDSVQKLRAQ
jgi:hypothetical protein